ncbi:Alanyl-tRNA editing protein Aarsd1 [Merluccius polli]|uniref:Alanyl-tRNA editing protein Aarsd1 n=1 Tax=Merluccius polli TaxID=89951 RepID=A0AA47N996_MERPO|nr:Alanyl-tRNA editing protein Aarsd1 [Merluccius polli]
MAFQCQRDCYMKEFVTSVVSCCPAELKQEVNGKKETVKGFNVILQDTILFPEGGGQPDDHGLIGDVPVLRVTRQGAEAVHFVGSPLEVGQEVQLKVDWDRRFDHMQQHSGQHLISALAETMFGFKTTSWEMGRQRSSIELDTPSVKPAQLQALEEALNDKIRDHVPVTLQLLSIDDPAVGTVKSRGLPDDHAGPIRIIDIEGIDANMCCGTHVSNLSQLQMIKLQGTEKGKKNKTNLIFLVGNRVLKYAEKCYSTERSLVSLLKTGPDEHVEAVDKIQKSAKLLQKSNLGLLRDMAVLIAQNFKSSPQRGNFFTLHKKEGDNEFMNIIANEIGTEETLVFLTVGEEKGPGLFLLTGPSDAVSEMGPRVLEMLQGKGAGKNGRFQGKANSLARREDVAALLQQRCTQGEEEYRKIPTKSPRMTRMIRPMKRHLNRRHTMNFMVLQGLVNQKKDQGHQPRTDCWENRDLACSDFFLSGPPSIISRLHLSGVLAGGIRAELLRGQVVKVEDEPPVEVAVSVQRPVVDVGLLLVLLHAWHPAAGAKGTAFVISP